MALYRTGLYVKNHAVEQVQVASTPIASFNGNVTGVYIPELIAYITAKQSGTGTPAPDNIRPIIGVSECNVTRCGKNIWSYGDVSGTRAVAVNDVLIPIGSYKISALVTSSDTDGTLSLILFACADGTNVSVRLTRDTRASETVSLTSPATSITFYAGRTSGSSVGDTFSFTDIQLEVGMATNYEAYTGTTYTIQLGQTVYVCYINVTTGELTITHNYIEYDGSEDEDWSIASDGTQRIAAPADMQKPDTTQSISNSATITDASTVGLGHFRIGNSNLIINVGTFADATTLKAYLANNNFEMLYPLATPITVQLTPTQIEQLLGANNVFADTGDVEVKFYNVVR